MKDDTQPLEQEQIIEEIKARQRNTVWPDTLVNGENVDAFLWKGSPNAPLVQRIGAWVFGIAFMLFGVTLIEIDRETAPYRKSILDVIFGVAVFGLGLKIFLNGFRRQKKEERNDQ